MEDVEKYRRADGKINWGKYAENQLLINDNLLLKKKTKNLDELTVFKLADELSDYTWKIVSKWDWFSKKTIGDQIVRASDSVGANIAEGYGRYFFGEYIVFLYYARGSLYEVRYWMEKARKRNLINKEEYEWIKDRTDKLPIELNKVIKIVKTEAQKWKGRTK